MTIDVGSMLVIIFELMIITNIITEVLKKVTWDKIPTNALVLVVAEALTIAADVAYCQMNGVAIGWIHIAAAIVVGLFVAYSAMFGFDKLRQAFEQIGGLKNE